ncbi:hypothetical protein MMPV_003616 [Pyropia vietnamensis]
MDSGLTTAVGDYMLYHTLGEGEFGKVKYAKHKDTGEVVAIKIMNKSILKERDFSRQVKHEIYILKRLSHRHIVHLREVLVSSTKLYLVMDYVNGGELFDLLEQRGALHEDEARRYFHQLVDAIGYCHSVGVSHRDLKLQPENLMLCKVTQELRITDFGFSAMRDKIDVLLHTQCGTPHYIAPEVIDVPKGGYNGAKADVWSIGVILYTLIVGNLPFDGENSDELFDAIMNCRVTYPSTVSPSARAVLERLLVLDPGARATLEEVKSMPWYLANPASRLQSSREPRAARGSRIASYKWSLRRNGAESSATAAVAASAPPRTNAPSPADCALPPLLSGTSSEGARGAMTAAAAATNRVSSGMSGMSLVSVPTLPTGGGTSAPAGRLAAEVDPPLRYGPPSLAATARDPPDPPSSPLAPEADGLEACDHEDSEDALSTAVTFIEDGADVNDGHERELAASADEADVPSPARLALPPQAPTELPNRSGAMDDMEPSARPVGDYPGSSHREWHVSDMSDDSVAFRLRGGSPGSPSGPPATADLDVARGRTGTKARGGSVPVSAMPETVRVPRPLGLHGGAPQLTSRDSSQVSVGDLDRVAGEPPQPISPAADTPLAGAEPPVRVPFRRPTLVPAAARRGELPTDRSAAAGGGRRSPCSPSRIGGGGSGGGGAHLLTNASVSLIRKTSALLHQAAHPGSSSAPASPRSDADAPVLGGPPTPPVGGQSLAQAIGWRRRMGNSSGRSSREGSGSSSPVLPPGHASGLLVGGPSTGSTLPLGEPTRALPSQYDGTPSACAAGEALASPRRDASRGAAKEKPKMAASSFGADGAAPWPVAPVDDLDPSRRSSVSDCSRRSSYDAKTVNSTFVQQSTTTSSRRARRPRTCEVDGAPRLSISSSSDGDLPSVQDFRDRSVQLVSFEPLRPSPGAARPPMVAPPSPPPSPPLPVRAPTPPAQGTPPRPAQAPPAPSQASSSVGVATTADRPAGLPGGRGFGGAPASSAASVRSRGPFSELRLPPGATSSPLPPLSGSPYGTSPVKEEHLLAGRSLAVRFAAGLHRWRTSNTPAAEVAEEVEALLDFLPGLPTHLPGSGAEAERFRGGVSTLRAFVVELSHSVVAGASDSRCTSPPGGVVHSPSDGGSSMCGEEAATTTGGSRKADGPCGNEAAALPDGYVDGHSDGECSADTTHGRERRRRQVSDLLRMMLNQVGTGGGSGSIRPSSPALSDPCLGSSGSGSSGRLRWLGADTMFSDDDCSIANIQAALMQVHGGRQESNFAAELEALVALQRQQQQQKQQQQQQRVQQHRLHHRQSAGGGPQRASSQLAHMSQSLPPAATLQQPGPRRRPEVQVAAVRSSSDTFVKLSERTNSATSHRVRSDMTCLPQAYVPSRASVSDCEGSEGVRTAIAQAARARAAACRGEGVGASDGAYDPQARLPSRPGREGGTRSGVGGRGGEGESRRVMAVSMGLSNVAYYDRGENGRGLSGHGLTRQVRSLLQSMRNRNHKLAEEMTQFVSDLDVQVLRHTRRKLKYRTVFAHENDHCGQWVSAYDVDGGSGGGLGGSAAAATDALTLCAVVDVEGEDGVRGRVPQGKTVCLRRSREDPRRVSTAQFQSFFHAFHDRFLSMVASQTGDEEHLVTSPTLTSTRTIATAAAGGGGGGRVSRRHRSRASSAAASGVAAGVEALTSARAPHEGRHHAVRVPLLSSGR